MAGLDAMGANAAAEDLLRCWRRVAGGVAGSVQGRRGNALAGAERHARVRVAGTGMVLPRDGKLLYWPGDTTGPIHRPNRFVRFPPEPDLASLPPDAPRHPSRLALATNFFLFDILTDPSSLCHNPRHERSISHHIRSRCPTRPGAGLGPRLRNP
jgi:hypothetical protein